MIPLNNLAGGTTMPLFCISPCCTWWPSVPDRMKWCTTCEVVVDSGWHVVNRDVQFEVLLYKPEENYYFLAMGFIKKFSRVLEQTSGFWFMSKIWSVDNISWKDFHILCYNIVVDKVHRSRTRGEVQLMKYCISRISFESDKSNSGKC